MLGSGVAQVLIPAGSVEPEAFRLETSGAGPLEGDAVRGLLEEPERAKRMGEAAKRRVRDQFLGARSLIDYLDLISRLLA